MRYLRAALAVVVIAVALATSTPTAGATDVPGVLTLGEPDFIDARIIFSNKVPGPPPIGRPATEWVELRLSRSFWDPDRVLYWIEYFKAGTAPDHSWFDAGDIPLSAVTWGDQLGHVRIAATAGPPGGVPYSVTFDVSIRPLVVPPPRAALDGSLDHGVSCLPNDFQVTDTTWYCSQASHATGTISQRFVDGTSAFKTLQAEARPYRPWAPGYPPYPDPYGPNQLYWYQPITIGG